MIVMIMKGDFRLILSILIVRVIKATKTTMIMMKLRRRGLILDSCIVDFLIDPIARKTLPLGLRTEVN